MAVAFVAALTFDEEEGGLHDYHLSVASGG
jgi:hypothetical protein